MVRAPVLLLALALLLGAAAPAHARKPDADRASDATDRAERIAAVVAAAESYVGLPYRLGREGPDIFDCSGLVYRVFADTGEVERIGGARMRAAGYMRWFGRHARFVEDPALVEMGDLVIYDSGGHIGIYVGDGQVISALVEGVTRHRLDGITTEVSGILKIDWSGAPGRPMPHPDAAAPPAAGANGEAPASLIAPLPWLEPLADTAAPQIAQAGTERPDMRSASSRTFENPDGTFTTELYGAPIFYQPPGSTDWQPIELRFAPTNDRTGLRVDTSPVAVELRAADARDGFLRLSSGDESLALGLPRGVSGRGDAARPVALEDGRFADYAELMRGGAGLRVFPRADGFKAFVVLPERPHSNQLTFSVTTGGITLAAEPDGSLSLVREAALGPGLDTETSSAPLVVGRIPRPLVLDSSDASGDGGALRVDGATLSTSATGDGALLTITLDPATLRGLTYPAYVDLSVTDFPTAAGATRHTFASSRYPTAALRGYQRPEAPAHAELWHGRLPGTTHYNEAFLRFPDLATTLAGATLEAAQLRFYPYWQYDLDGPRPTWISRIAQDWHPDTLSWELRPAVDGELGRFETRAGQWSDIDITGYVADVLAGRLSDFGFRLHADGGGRGSWKRIVGGADATDDASAPRMVLTWSNLTPLALEPTGAGGIVTLAWQHATLAPPPARYEVQVSADGFGTLVARQRGRGAAADATSWELPQGVLEPGVDYAWRVRARYGSQQPWSAWSEPIRFAVGPSAPTHDTSSTVLTAR